MPKSQIPFDGPVQCEAAGRKPARFLPKKEVLRRVGISYTSAWELMVRGEFPRSRQVGRRVFWIEQEIEDFIKNCPVSPLKGDLR